MAKKYFIDGTIVATTGNLYTRDSFAGCTEIPSGCIVIKAPQGIWEVVEPTGSMFDTYYARGNVVATGIGNGDVYAFKSIYEFTIRDYKNDWKRLRSMLDVDIPDDQRSLFLQQQLVSSFSLLENFLSCTFLRETCDREDSYHEVWKSGCLDRHIHGADQQAIKKGPDCVQKELLYIEAVNKLIYHNAAFVKTIFQVAFGITVQLDPVEDEIKKRHDIVHRFGYDQMGNSIEVNREEILSLLLKIDEIADDVSRQILLLPSMPD